MKELINKLARQAKEIKTEIEALEPQVKEAEQAANNSQQAFEQVLNKIRNIEERERVARKEVISWRQRNTLDDEKTELNKQRNEDGMLFSRLDRQLQDKIDELQKLESSLFAEKRAKQHKKEMTELKLERDEKDKALSDLKAREEKENVQLDALKQERDEKMNQAFLSEVQHGENSPETERLNKKFNEGIALQESRLEALNTVIKKTEADFLSACDAFKEAKTAYHYYEYKLAELGYKVALRGFMPALAKYKATERMAGFYNGEEISIRVEDDLIDEQAAKLQKELEEA